MNLYTMADAYETAEFKRRKPMTARAKQAISRALKGKRKRRGGGMSLTGRTTAGKAVRALGAAAALGVAARYGSPLVGGAVQGARTGAGIKQGFQGGMAESGRRFAADTSRAGRVAGQGARQVKGAGLRAMRAAKNTVRRGRKAANKAWSGS